MSSSLPNSVARNVKANAETHKNDKNKNVTFTNQNSRDLEPTAGKEMIVGDKDEATNDHHITTDFRSWQQPIKWTNLIAISTLHIGAVHGLFLCLTEAKVLTGVWIVLVSYIAAFGVTGGAHRLWTHRSYKAKKPLQIILLICYSVAGQNKIYDWVRDHRVHHKFSETDADPHNSRRGFFFSHVGWLLQMKHPQVIRKGKATDLSDIAGDALITEYTKYFWLFKAIFCFILPTVVPVYLWSEKWKCAIFSQIFLRYALVLNSTWSVNSFAHIWGNKPFDKNIQPVENTYVAFLAAGEGWHNYHHVFPWDYKAAELGGHILNVTTLLLDFFAKIGWAYDLKTASPKLVEKYIKNQGDGTHYTLQ